ncbi:HtaA domain-containing protein [Microbacterium sp. NPDC077644]|uniref:HtaA domain-containing protein n=1 Tax=Microbacterium sp. NPDC077644 TaxID=3155055 RepID=UPI00344EEF17
MADDDADRPGTIWESRGVLRWGVRESLRSYVEGLPGGEIRVLDGAERLSSGGFGFPLTSALADHRVGDLDEPLDFGGAVRFTGYNGLLRFEIAHPRLERDGDSVVLSVSDNLDETLAERIPFGSSLASSIWMTGPTRRTAKAVKLTGAGAALLGDVYPEGSMLDPWTLTLFTD